MGTNHLLIIDGSQGEGGGQILRTSLALSLVTGRPFRMTNIRAGRQRPGLLAQHLAAVRAAAEVGRAEVQGASLGSQQIEFRPTAVAPGEYYFAVGTAGSATLVLQTVLPALWTARGPSALHLEGGTHNPWAPPVEFIQKSFLPLLARMGPKITLSLERHGFYPAGGGLLRATIEPAPALQPLELRDRGPIRAQRATALVSRLPLAIAERELRVIRAALGWRDELAVAKTVASAGPGNVVQIEIETAHLTEVFTEFGQKGVPAEKVAQHLVAATRRYLAADVPVGEHLADQLLLPLALAGGGVFRTLPPSSHMSTNIAVIRQFLDVDIDCNELARDNWEITVGVKSC